MESRVIANICWEDVTFDEDRKGELYVSFENIGFDNRVRTFENLGNGHVSIE